MRLCTSYKSLRVCAGLKGMILVLLKVEKQPYVLPRREEDADDDMIYIWSNSITNTEKQRFVIRTNNKANEPDLNIEGWFTRTYL